MLPGSSPNVQNHTGAGDHFQARQNDGHRQKKAVGVEPVCFDQHCECDGIEQFHAAGIDEHEPESPADRRLAPIQKFDG